MPAPDSGLASSGGFAVRMTLVVLFTHQSTENALTELTELKGQVEQPTREKEELNRRLTVQPTTNSTDRSPYGTLAS